MLKNSFYKITGKAFFCFLVAFIAVLLSAGNSSAVSRLTMKQFQPLFDKGAEFTGNKECRTCHEDISKSFSETKHQNAFLTLTSRGKEDDNKCIVCHVTGNRESGGFKSIDETPAMAGVQCESCHGPASLHVGKVEVGDFSLSLCTPCHTLGNVEGMAGECDRCHPDYKRHIEKLKRRERIIRKPDSATCTECHDNDNDPQFNYERNFIEVSHKPPAQPLPEVKSNDNVVLLPSKPNVKGDVDYVGNSACIKCHGSAYKKWASTPHAKSFETLVEKKEQMTTRCLRCHATGYGKKSGFLDEKSTPSLKEVGCETCHGPGKDHIEADDDRKKNTIYGITSDCPSCSAARTCKRCHTIREDAEFDTARDLELIRCDRPVK